ncbi:sensor histidine kinase [Pseudoalteromonas sp. T1lg23B]|uniref:sensor histidine kinase n=1 Tax=Pseudoalteromonas sp. T1lg23B TaxID=2077097 RepID=UPI00131A2528|nr:sensor histidine kinase [Pseudoalteromonas sp. T1lg23B]
MLQIIQDVQHSAIDTDLFKSPLFPRGMQIVKVSSNTLHTHFVGKHDIAFSSLPSYSQLRQAPEIRLLSEPNLNEDSQLVLETQFINDEYDEEPTIWIARQLLSLRQSKQLEIMTGLKFSFVQNKAAQEHGHFIAPNNATFPIYIADSYTVRANKARPINRMYLRVELGDEYSLVHSRYYPLASLVLLALIGGLVCAYYHVNYHRVVRSIDKLTAFVTKLQGAPKLLTTRTLWPIVHISCHEVKSLQSVIQGFIDALCINRQHMLSELGEKIRGQQALKFNNTLLLDEVVTRGDEVAQKRAELKKAAMRAKLLANKRQSLAIKLLNAQEEERTRLSRELHDGVAPQLLAVKIYIQMCIASAHAEEPLAKVVDMITSASQDLRHLAHGLRAPDYAESSLSQLIKGFVENFAGNEIQIQLSLASIELSNESHKEHLFRCFQEALCNAQKHACASLIRVELSVHGTCIVLVVEDNGRGLSSLDKQTGLGLLTMEERANLIGAQFSIRSVNPKGTRVEFQLPL